MRLCAALALVGLAACSFQPRAANVTGDAPGSGDAPPGIDAPTGDAPVDALADTDGDGVPDVIDNCPTMPNTDQRDHDVDGRGDVCDLCPGIKETVDTDTDGDGVGDACDPRPTMAGDQRVLFVGFYDQSDIASWPVSSGATATVSQGHLVIGNTQAGLQYTFPNVNYTNAYAMTSVHATAVGATMRSPALELIVGDNSVDASYYCYALVGPNGNSANAYDFWPTQMPQNHGMPWPGVVTNDLTITDKVAGSTHMCSFAQAGAATAMPMETASSSHAGLVILGAQGATAAFDYLFIVEMGS